MAEVGKEQPAKNELRLPPQLSQEIESIVTNPQQRKRLEKVFSVFVSRSYSGALPPPEMLKQFEEILPGLAERIVCRMEKQSEHRMSLESKVVSAQLSESKRGQWLGFIIAILFLGASIWLAHEGHIEVASILGGTTIIGLVTVFVIGKNKMKKDFE
jgi:uncharacterized membrane protein